MPTAHQRADLILRLYELRRDPEMRAARDWFFSRFHPKSAQEVFAQWMGPDSAHYRMVTTYWEMAATLVTHDAIDPGMFHAANTEYAAVIAKLGPFLAELRALARTPHYLEQLERVVQGMPDGESRLDGFRRYMKHKEQQGNRD